MLRHMQAANHTPLCIARHTIQFIWNISSQENSMGLLGRRNNLSIDSVTTISSYDSQDIAPIAAQWQKENIALCGIFHNQPMDTIQMQNHEVMLQIHFKDHTDTPFIHLQIISDTKGCLESQAWILEDEQAVKVPLLLLEDGQHQQIS